MTTSSVFIVVECAGDGTFDRPKSACSNERLSGQNLFLGGKILWFFFTAMFTFSVSDPAEKPRKSYEDEIATWEAPENKTELRLCRFH